MEGRGGEKRVGRFATLIDVAKPEMVPTDLPELKKAGAICKTRRMSRNKKLPRSGEDRGGEKRVGRFAT